MRAMRVSQMGRSAMAGTEIVLTPIFQTSARPFVTGSNFHSSYPKANALMRDESRMAMPDVIGTSRQFSLPQQKWAGDIDEEHESKYRQRTSHSITVVTLQSCASEGQPS